MIDIHNHSLYGQDDGAKTLADAMRMLALAYHNGTRTIVLTPHKNHPHEFQQTIDEDEAFTQMHAIAQEKFPGLSLIKGFECYVSQLTPEMIASLKQSTIGNTDYVLIEFSVMATLDFMLNVIHEMRVAGLNPIVAHIEVYQSVNGNLKAVESLKNEGALLQITGSSLIGKRGKTTAQWILSLIEKGLVDFVASDGHGLESRRPSLDKVRDYILHKMGEEAALVLLEKNPKAMIENMPISYFNKNKQRFQTRSAHRRKQTSRTVLATASLLGVAVVTASIVMAMNPQVREQINDYKGDVLGIKQPENISQTEASTQVATEETSNTQLEAQTEVAATTTAKSGETQTAKEEKASDIKSINNAETGQKMDSGAEASGEAELVEKYRAQLSALQGYYESKLKSQVIMAREELKSVKSKEERNKLYVKYANQINALESQSDEDVNAVLYDLQTALENKKLTIDSVKLARAEYADTKAARKSYFLDLLKQ